MLKPGRRAQRMQSQTRGVLGRKPSWGAFGRYHLPAKREQEANVGQGKASICVMPYFLLVERLGNKLAATPLFSDAA